MNVDRLTERQVFQLAVKSLGVLPLYRAIDAIMEALDEEGKAALAEQLEE